MPVSSTARPVHIAVIGAGRIGEVHLSNLTRRVQGVEVTGVHDADATRAWAIAATYGVAVRPTLEALFSEGNPEAVVIGSPSALHLDHVKQAAAAGLHVLCEKPLALDEAGIEEAIAICAEHGRLLQVGFNRRFDPNTLAMRDAVETGRLGAL